MAALYDTIGRGYTSTRATDLRIAQRIWAALGEARSVLNVGAGTGNYEPGERRVVALEPSPVMIAQRPAGSAPVVRGIAERLPFADGAFEAAMSVLSDHHWSDRAAAVREMRRVASGPVVLFTWDDRTCWDGWITRDYLPGFATLIPPHARMADITDELGDASVTSVPIPADCEDGFYHAFWRRPEAYLDPAVRRGISVFARLDEAEVADGMVRLAADLESGAWQERNAGITRLTEMDLGYRLIVSPGPGSG